MRNDYGCHSFNVGDSKRGDNSGDAPLIVQDGYTYVFNHLNGSIQRFPILVEHKPEWLDIACGHMTKTTDKQCAGCINQNR